MKAIFRTVAFGLTVPVILLAVMCCHFSGPAMAAQTMSCCSGMSSTHSSQAPDKSSGQSVGTEKGNCECFTISGIVDKAYSQSFAVSKTDFLTTDFYLASQASDYSVQRFFNYHSPPKVVRNSLPFYLQASVRPPPFSIL